MLFIILEETPQLPPKVTHKFQQQTLQGRKQTEQTGVVTNIIIFCKLHFLENKLTYKWGTFQHPTWPKIIEIVFRAPLSIAKILLPTRKILLYYLISLAFAFHLHIYNFQFGILKFIVISVIREILKVLKEQLFMISENL